jgi:serine/threonine protein kinase
VHRDIKPDNFLMNSVGDVKLIDFALAQRVRHGIAKLFRGRSKIQGTRSYMSPEQIRMQALDQRADIYSFGCMIFELLGGRPPFTGNSTNDLLMKHLNSAPPSVQTLNRNVTEQFAQLIRRAMAKRPADRPASMDDFLQEFLSVELFKVPPKPATA